MAIFLPEAIVDLPLEIIEVTFLVALAAVAITTTRYIRRLRSTLTKLQKELDDQSRFTHKLNETVDHMLKIEEEGGIDSNRRKRP